MSLIQDNQARINKLESLYGKIKTRTEKTIVSDNEPENPTLGLQWFDTTELAFKIWGGRDWETTTVKSLSVGLSPNWFRVDESGNIWSGKENLSSAQTDTFAVLNNGQLYANNAYVRGNIYAESGTFTGNISSSATITVKGSIDSGKVVIDGSDDSIRAYSDNNTEFFTVSPHDNYFFLGKGDNYLEWDETGGLTVRGDIQASSVTIGAVGSTGVSFNYAGSSSKGGNANDTNYVNGQSASTVATGGIRASNALSLNNRYINWLSAGEMASATLPSSGVVIGSQGIVGRKSGVTTFEIQASTGDAYFRGNIYAESGTFTGNITSSATITGGTIRTASSGQRVEINSELGLIGLDSSGIMRTRISTGGILEFRTTGNSLTGSVEGVNISRPIVGGTSGGIYNSNGAIIANGDIIAYGGGNILTNNYVYASRFYAGTTNGYYTSAGGGDRPYWSGSSDSGSILFSRGVSASTATATRKVEVDIGGTIYYLLATT